MRCEQLPRPGETVLATSSQEVCGGKGANQAVAAVRAGGRVAMVGRVGDDVFASRLLDNLTREKIDCSHVRMTANRSSGLAVIGVEDGGQNAIMVVAGANGCVTADDVVAAGDLIATSDMLMLQLEIPHDAVAAAIAIAKQTAVRIVLDPAPAPPGWRAEWTGVDLLCPNESEAATLVGRPVQTIEHAQTAARILHQQGARQVAVTLGQRGTLLFDGDEVRLIESFPVTAVDTTAAGDAFAGAVAVRWAAGWRLDEAVRFANAAGALSATREGAQPSMATRQEIEALAADGPESS